MTAEELRRRLEEKDLSELGRRLGTGEPLAPVFREIVGSVAEGYGEEWIRIVDAAPLISELANSLFAGIISGRSDRESVSMRDFTELEAFMSGDWAASGRAAAGLVGRAMAADVRVVGAADGGTYAGPLPPESWVAEAASDAVAVAVAETLDRDGSEDRYAARALRGLVAEGPDGLRDRYDRLMERGLLGSVRNARITGHGPAACRAKACAAHLAERGKAFQGEKDGITVLALGAAGLEASSRREADQLRLPSGVLLGRAAMASALGFTPWWTDAAEAPAEPVLVAADPLRPFDRYDVDHGFRFIAFGLVPLAFTWKELAPLAILRVRSACRRLEAVSASPETPPGTASRFSALAGALRAQAAGWPDEMSLSRVLDIEEVSPEEGELTHGMRLHAAAPVGPRPASLRTRGKGGREMLLTAMADGAGRLVGYAGVDPLSEEFHGVPERYVYDLGGWRRGRLEGGVYRSGLPRKMMMTAPEGIDIAIREKKPA